MYEMYHLIMVLASGYIGVRSDNFGVEYFQMFVATLMGFQVLED